MASSLIQQAVELARAGQREEAASLLRHVVQADPNNVVAWLWLASVASNQPEYVGALNAVLRIDPNHERARRLLVEFNAQYGALPDSKPAGPASTPQPASVVPPSAGYEAYAPPAAREVPSYLAQDAPPSPPPSPMPRPAVSDIDYDDERPAQVHYVTEREVVVRERRGCLRGCLPGCGCGLQSCLLLIVALMALVIACGVLSYLPNSLGPVDIPASYLPDEFGRKEVDFSVDGHAVTLTVPRSWMVAERDNPMWEVGRDVLDEVAPFKNAAYTWSQFESAAGQGNTLIDINPITLLRGGDRVGMRYGGTEEGYYVCDAVRANTNEFDEYYVYENGLCGWRVDSVEPWQGAPLMEIDPPKHVRTVEFRVPLDESRALVWLVFLPESLYSEFRSDIDVLVADAHVG